MVNAGMQPREALREVEARLTAAGCPDADFDAGELFRLVYPVAPHLFAMAGPACVSGPCPEGKMCCGRTAEVRAKYEAIKQEAGV